MIVLFDLKIIFIRQFFDLQRNNVKQVMFQLFLGYCSFAISALDSRRENGMKIYTVYE